MGQKEKPNCSRMALRSQPLLQGATEKERPSGIVPSGSRPLHAFICQISPMGSSWRCSNFEQCPVRSIAVNHKQTVFPATGGLGLKRGSGQNTSFYYYEHFGQDNSLLCGISPGIAAL